MMTMNDQARRLGKDALTKLAREEDLDSAELRCTAEGWTASTASIRIGRRFGSAEEALDALVKQFDGWRNEAQRDEAPEPEDAA